jgi:hypothetical protein
MKFVLITSLLTFGISAQGVEYVKNDGHSLPETFTSKSTTATEARLINGSGLSTSEMNPSPNPAPKTEEELIESTTLRNKKAVRAGDFDPGAPIEEIEAQEEGPLDYSTTPQRRPAKPKELKEQQEKKQ